MRYVIAFLMKFLMISFVLWIAFNWFFEVSFLEMLTISILLTGISYIGDVFILPHLQNFTAAILDFALAWAVIWILGAFFLEQPIPLESVSLVSAAIIALGEFFFHRYMKDRVLDDVNKVDKDRDTLIQNHDFQTEFGSDTDIDSPDKPSPDKEK